MAIFSVTEIGTYRRCRWQWDYTSRNRQNLQPVAGRAALSVGTLVHRAHASWLNDDTASRAMGNGTMARKSLSYFALQHSQDFINDAVAKYTEHVGAPPSDLEMEELYSQATMAHAMCQNYEARWHDPLPDGFSIVAPEQTIIVPIPGTEHMCKECLGTGVDRQRMDAIACCTTCDGTGKVHHYLEGTLDGLLKDQYGRLFILEHKTYGQRPKPETLQRNDQFIGYLWLLNRAGLGEVGGLAYDGMWKREKPPRNSTLEDLFLRLVVVRTSRELFNFEKWLAATANEMGSPNLPMYPNVPWMGCIDCDFVKVCNAQMRGDDTAGLISTFYTQRGDDKQMAAVEQELAGA